MLTPRGYLFTEVISIVTCLWGSNCVIFSHKTKTAFTHPLLILRYRIQALMICSYVLFMIYRTLEVKVKDPDNLKDFNLSYGFTLSLMMACVAYVCEFFDPQDCALVINQLFWFAEDYRKKWIEKYDPKTLLSGYFLDKVFLAISIITLVGSLIASLPYFMYPTLPIYLPTLFPNEIANHWTVYWGFGLILVGCCYVIMGLFWILSSTGIAYFCCAVPILMTELRPNQKKYATKNALRHHARLPLFYRQFELVHRAGIRILGKIFLPLQFLIGKFVLYGNFTLVRYAHSLTDADLLRIASFVCILQAIWFVTLELSGLFYKQSIVTLRSWKGLKIPRKEDRKYMSRFRKSCRPLYIGTEGYFVIRRLTVLKFLRANIRGTFRALVAVKSYASH